ncbi:MAG: YegS/Rv2252/BmrU family lipid kinase [Actinomycetota bacterium]|nr:YegS/Rv2252/BmrU family lipid kinase [Actinomycetota bacterium]
MASRCALLVNPAAGRGKHGHLVQEVRDRLAAQGVHVRVLQGADGAEAADLAATVVAEGYDVLAVMGGDGMVHLALDPLTYSTTRLGIIATGTGNDVARYLGLPRGSPLDAADVIVRGHTRVIDVARAGPTAYVTVLATGFDSLVNERANRLTWPRGRMRYNLATLAALRVLAPLPYTLELDGVRRQLQAILVAVGNGPSYGGGLRICEGAEIDDGLLDVVIIKPISKVELLKVYPRLFKGTHISHPSYEHHRVRTVNIASPGIVAYADGERLGPLPLAVEALPSALTVCVPESSP